MPFEYETSGGNLGCYNCFALPHQREILDNPTGAVLFPADLCLRGIEREILLDAARDNPGPVWVYLARHLGMQGEKEATFLAPLVQALLAVSKTQLPRAAFAAQAKLLAAVRSALEQPSEAEKKADPGKEILQKRYDAIVKAASTLMTAAAVVENEMQHLAAELQARLKTEIEEEKLGTAWGKGA